MRLTAPTASVSDSKITRFNATKTERPDPSWRVHVSPNAPAAFRFDLPRKPSGIGLACRSASQLGKRMPQRGYPDTVTNEGEPLRDDLRANATEMAPSLTIIVVMGSEASHTYAQFRLMAPLRRCGVELIAVDDGRNPEARKLAQRQATRLITVPGNRAQQFNVAAAFARGRNLLLLTPGVILPGFVDQLVEQALDADARQWGWIDLRLGGGSLRHLRSLWLAWRVGVTNQLTDAHPLFVKREAFLRVRGVPTDARHAQTALAQQLHKAGLMPVRIRPKALVRPEFQ